MVLGKCNEGVLAMQRILHHLFNPKFRAADTTTPTSNEIFCYYILQASQKNRISSCPTDIITLNEGRILGTVCHPIGGGNIIWVINQCGLCGII